MKTTDKPNFQEFHIEGVKHIGPEDAFKSLENNEAIMIDVREEPEVGLEYIPFENVINHPMSLILDRLPQISRDLNIILMCPGGVRSSKVANLLNIQGYPNVANLFFSSTLWKAKGLPYESVLPAGGCSGGCSSCKPGTCC